MIFLCSDLNFLCFFVVIFIFFYFFFFFFLGGGGGGGGVPNSCTLEASLPGNEVLNLY